MASAITHPPYNSRYASTDKELITNVIGFDLSGRVTYVDEYGNEQDIRTGCKTVVCVEEDDIIPEWLQRKGMLDLSFFTNYDEHLMNKIRDFRQINK